MSIEEMVRESKFHTDSRIEDLVSKVESVLDYCFPELVVSGIANESVIVAYMGITIEFDFAWDFVHNYIYVTDKVVVQSASLDRTKEAIEFFREMKAFIRVIMKEERRTYPINPIAKYLV